MADAGLRRRVLTALFAAAAAALGGCGDGSSGGASADRTPPAAVTPVPSGTPVPSPTDGIHATPTSEATATPTATAPSGAGTGGAEAGGGGEGTGGAEAGDEAGIRVPVDVTVSSDRIRASTTRVAAFLPLRLTVRNTLDRELQVVVVRSGEGGGSVARVTVPAGGTAATDVEGLRPGSLEVLSPDLDPDMTAIVRVARGG